MAQIELNDCTATFHLEPYPDCPQRMHYLTGTVTHTTLGELATLRGFVLCLRYQWKELGDFYLVMDGESEELMNFATDVFDEHMNVHPWLIDGGYRSGTGCWGEELNRGDVIYLEDITVKEPYLRRGVGSWLLRAFLLSSHTQSGSYFTHVYCWPTSVAPLEPDENVIAFFRKNGFRRVGRTSFLCYSTDDEHPSRALGAEDDCDMLPKFKATSDLTPEEEKLQFPLHAAISSNKNAEIADVIKKMHDLDLGNIHKANSEGYTPTHVAASTENLHALRALTELGVANDLKNLNNKDGITPLDGLKNVMSLRRKFHDDTLNTWEGHPDVSLKCEYLLIKAMGMPLLSQNESEYVAKRKLGCSCGNCLEGWFSERMKYRLEMTAISKHETMRDDMAYTYTGKGRGGSQWDSDIDDLMLFDKDYIPPSLRPRIDRTFCRAWCSAFRAIYDVLQSPNPILSSDSVAFQLAMLEFTARGVKAEHVLDALTGLAKGRSCLGDSTFEEAHGEIYDTLPKCENDLAFNLVRRKFGLDPRLPWAPYYNPDENRESSEDEDDDSD